MNFTNWKKITLLLCVGFSTTLPITEQECPVFNQNDVPQEIIDEHNEFVEHNLKNILAGYSRVDEMLQELAHVANNDQIPGLRNKRILIGEIVTLRGVIESIKSDTYAQVNPVHLYLLTKILDAMTDHVHQAIKDGFHQLPTFNLESIVKRSLDISNLDASVISSSIAAAHKKIETVYQESQSVGLHWYNKVYRKLDDYVLQPLDRYKVPQRTAKTALAAALPFLVWFYTDRGVNPETLKKIDLKTKMMDGSGSSSDKVLEALMKLHPKMSLEEAYKTAFKQSQIPEIIEPSKCYRFEHWLRSKVGPHAHIAGHSDILTHFHHHPDTQLGMLGNIDYSLRKYNSGLMPIGALVLAYTLPTWTSELSNAAGWIRKKAQAFHNFMRGGAYKNIVPTQQGAEIIKLEPRITFDDIIGLEHAKHELSFILEYIKNPEAWDRLKLKLEKGFLLTGPTRTGKSFIAEALAGEIKKILKKQNRNADDFGFYIITGSFIAQNGIKGILEAAKREAPCVLFIDEIDLLSLQRTGDKNMLNEFLTALSGCMDADLRRQVILLAATNRSQNLDPALKQEGRFGTEICFEYPSFEYRKQHLVRSLSNLAVNVDMLDIDRIAHETEGCSFEKLNAIIRYAFQKCKVRGCALNQEILDEALDAKLRHIIFKDAKKLPDNEQAIIAAHQASQAFIVATENTGQKLAKVTIRPRIKTLREEMAWDVILQDEEKKQRPIVYGGIFTYHDTDTLNLLTKAQKMNEIKRLVSGHITEDMVLEASGHSYERENSEEARKLATSLVTEGYDIDKMPTKHQAEFFDQSFALVKQCKTEVRKVLETNKEKIKLLAKHLQERLSLSGDEVQSIITTGALPVKATKTVLGTTTEGNVPVAQPQPKDALAKQIAAPSLAAAAA